MPRYEFLFLRKDGRVVDRFAFKAPDDSYARAAADDIRGSSRRQLWCGERWLTSWEVLAT